MPQNAGIECSWGGGAGPHRSYVAPRRFNEPNKAENGRVGDLQVLGTHPWAVLQVRARHTVLAPCCTSLVVVWDFPTKKNWRGSTGTQFGTSPANGRCQILSSGLSGCDHDRHGEITLRNAAVPKTPSPKVQSPNPRRDRVKFAHIGARHHPSSLIRRLLVDLLDFFSSNLVHLPLSTLYLHTRSSLFALRRSSSPLRLTIVSIICPV